jgi:tRNA pseudouridine38-40 synthase
MFYYKVTIAYKGTAYSGWQAQALDDAHEKNPTVQGIVQKALNKVTKYQAFSLSGASRTDAGVHARSQLARISLEHEIPAKRLQMAMNAQLPDDVQLMHCVPCSKQFNPHTISSVKEYHYYFSFSQLTNPVFNDIVGCELGHPLDDFSHQERIEKMTKACQLFVGTHDFQNFCNKDKKTVSTVRTVTHCDIHSANFSPLGENIYYIKIYSNGFLRYMVRFIAGALFEVFKGRIELEDISNYLNGYQSKRLSLKAKSKGLHLISITAK